MDDEEDSEGEENSNEPNKSDDKMDFESKKFKKQNVLLKKLYGNSAVKKVEVANTSPK